MTPRSRSKRWSITLGALALRAGGGSAMGLAVASQEHAPQPTPKAAGTTGPARSQSRNSAARASTARPRTAVVSHLTVGPTLPRSTPVVIDIPAIGVISGLQDLGLASTGTTAVPQPGSRYGEAAWYDDSPTRGQIGPSIIEGHIDSGATGPSVVFRLGALTPGDTVDVTLANGAVAVFTVTGAPVLEGGLPDQRRLREHELCRRPPDHVRWGVLSDVSSPS